MKIDEDSFEDHVLLC